jgi:CubicO group peptidase (beta-lactamase class C family)
MKTGSWGALTLCVVAGAILVAGPRQGRNAVIATRLDALITDLQKRELFSGALVVGDDRGVLWQKGVGFADKTRGVAFTPDTPSDGASLAKTFTAALVLDLQAEGRLRLDDPVRKYLPALPYDDITVRHLLSHSSGLPSDYAYFDPFIPANTVRTTESLLAVIAAQKPKLAFTPGTAFEYSSFAYDVAALTAARAAGTTYEALLRERIFRPLGISSAFLRPGRLDAFPGIRTLAYRRAGPSVDLHDVFDFEHFHGGSNIYISARDLHAWNVGLMTHAVVPRAAADIARFARIGRDTSGLTLGSWYRSPEGDALWYAGHLEGFHSEVFRDTRARYSIVYHSNNTIEPWLQLGLVRDVRWILAGLEPRPLSAPASDPVRKEDYPALTGRWRMDNGDKIAVETTNGRIRMRRRGIAYEMFPVSATTFYAPGLHFMISFSRDGGAVLRMHVATALSETSGTR